MEAHAHWVPSCSVAQSSPTLCDPMDYSPSGSSVHGILQARIVEGVAISFSRGSSRPRDQMHVSWIVRWIIYHWATWEVPCGGSWVQNLQGGPAGWRPREEPTQFNSSSKAFWGENSLFSGEDSLEFYSSPHTLWNVTCFTQKSTGLNVNLNQKYLHRNIQPNIWLNI